MIHTHTFEVGGKTISLETGRVAKQAGGAVLLGCGDTVILAAVTMSKEPRPGTDFLPLTVDYEERKYSVGKIPGGFIKRGGRPSDRAILTSRLIDRPIRPLFPYGMRNDLQVIATPFAVDQDFPADVLAITAVGAALTISDIPFDGPIAGVRVGMIDGELILYPSQSQIAVSDLDLCVAGHKGAISMVEAGAKEVTEADMVRALNFAHDAIKKICVEIEKFAKSAAKPKRTVALKVVDETLIKKIEKAEGKSIAASLVNPDKASRESALHDIMKEIVAKYTPEYADQPELLAQLPEAVDKVIKKTVRKLIIEDGKRPDGRGVKDIRPVEAVPGLLPKVHGSGLFTRGQTQVLTVATLGMPGDAQTMDGIEEVPDKRYMHFYNFPSYSVGEVRPNRGPGRREIGHGALAERALLAVLPLDDPNFPYTMLLISETLESNGSSSMGSVCGSTLALMDAGIPIKAPVAGIAMGLMTEGKNYKILTDIQGMEDFCGDMDFKVAGTRGGITALQLDTKLDGIPEAVLKEALAQAKEARYTLLDIIEEAIPTPRTEVNPNAPRVTTITINPEKIGAVIGPGGAQIRKITSESGAQVDIQQDGRVLIGGTDSAQVNKAIEMIKGLTASAEVGSEYEAVVNRIMGKGVLVEFMPGKNGLIPNEHLSTTGSRPDDLVKLGDKINVKVYEVDAEGRANLTALGLAQSLATLSGNEAADPSTVKVQSSPGRGGDRGGRGGFGGRDRGGDRGGRDRDRGGYGGRDRDRGDRGDRGGDRPERSERPDRGDRPERAPREAVVDHDSSAPEVPDAFPKRGGSGDDEVNARFRPRR